MLTSIYNWFYPNKKITIIKNIILYTAHIIYIFSNPYTCISFLLIQWYLL